MDKFSKDQLVNKEDLFYEQIFYEQIQTLGGVGTPPEIIEAFRIQRKKVVQRASEIPTKGIPFIPVIPLAYRGIFDLMAMVIYHGNRGFTSLDPTLIIDITENKMPVRPYYIYDVVCGIYDIGSKNPKKAIDIIKKRKRFPLTVAEVIALAVHTDVSTKPIFAGSSYGENDGMVCLFLNGSDPCLDQLDQEEVFWFGMPLFCSCGSRG